MSDIASNDSASDDFRAEQFAKEIAHAKRAPEIAAWLRLGPLSLPEIIAFRQERMIERGTPEDVARRRAPQTVFYDLGRVAALGGPVQYEGGMYWLDETQRGLIDRWVREDDVRFSGIVPDEV